MVSGELKVLYNINQILKKQGEYFYNVDTEKFYSAKGNVIFESTLFKKVDTLGLELVITNGANFFKFLKSLDSEFDTVLKIINTPDSFLHGFRFTNNYDSNTIIKRSKKIQKSKVLFKSVNDLYVPEFNNYLVDIGQIKEVLMKYKAERNHLILFLDIDIKKRHLNLHKDREEINYTNGIQLITIFSDLPFIKTKVKDTKNFSVVLYENNMLEVTYGTQIETTTVYFRLS